MTWTKYELELAAWLSRISSIPDETQVIAALKQRTWSLISLIVNEKTDTHGFLARDSHGNQALVFRCTTTWKNVQTDLRAEPTHGLGCIVHNGFWDAYSSVSRQIHELIDANPITRQPTLSPASAMRGGEVALLVVGHSLGGALATLAALDLTFSPVCGKRVGLITLGCPRVGFKDFVEMFEERIGNRCVRIMCGSDIVAQIPVSPYKHPGGLLHLDLSGNELGKLGRGWVMVRNWFRSLFGFGVALARWESLPYHAWTFYNQAIQNIKLDWERKS